ncbi:hypothetical protein J2W42_000753 [Rhizobium tibeticum]|uniref:hypothetical protein n=1 Tax=Rhizobium tibeticum TaxID=501024 RepID=UPI0027877E65|nr:hypothetical protein [Rhizobium tibeticum]MDP9807915.1 hypothetical protein [Rhizobium tibeticum]
MTTLETRCLIALLLACAALLGARISLRSALFQGLHLVASAKTAFVDAANELKTSAARLVLLTAH